MLTFCRKLYSKAKNGLSEILIYSRKESKIICQELSDSISNCELNLLPMNKSALRLIKFFDATKVQKESSTKGKKKIEREFNSQKSLLVHILAQKRIFCEILMKYLL